MNTNPIQAMRINNQQRDVKIKCKTIKVMLPSVESPEANDSEKS